MSQRCHCSQKDVTITAPVHKGRVSFGGFGRASASKTVILSIAPQFEAKNLFSINFQLFLSSHLTNRSSRLCPTKPTNKDFVSGDLIFRFIG